MSECNVIAFRCTSLSSFKFFRLQCICLHDSIYLRSSCDCILSLTVSLVFKMLPKPSYISFWILPGIGLTRYHAHELKLSLKLIFLNKERLYSFTH